MLVRETMVRTVLALLTAMVVALFAAAADARTDVSGVRLGSHPDGVTRVVMDLSEGMDFTVSSQVAPDRIIVSTPELDWNTGVTRAFGSVRGLRYEGVGAGGRIVLELKDPSLIKSAFVIAPRDGQGWRFVMDLQQTTQAAFLASVTKTKAAPPARAIVRAPVAPVAAPAPVPVVAAPVPQRIVLYSPEAPPPPAAVLKPEPVKIDADMVKAEPVKLAAVKGEPVKVVAAANAAPFPVEPAGNPPLAPPSPAKPGKAAKAGGSVMSAPVPPPLERPAPQPTPPPAAAAPAPSPTPMPAIAAVPPLPAPAMTEPMVTKVSAPMLADPEPKGLPADGRPVIVIDPGHGGVDPGAIGVSGIYEKNITLAVAREVKAALEKGNRYKVHLTRDRDVFIRLRERVAIGRQYGADLFISLHADSVANPQLKGLSVYTLSQNASDSEAQALADKENKADLIAGIDLSHESADVANILIDLAQRETMNRSAIFASGIVDEVGRETPLLGNTHRFAGFAVLKAPDVPSVLIELGYLSNETEERNLRQSEYRARLGKAVARSIDQFFLQGQKAKRP